MWVTIRIFAVCFALASNVFASALVAAQMSTAEQADSVERLKTIAKTLQEMQQQIPQHHLSPEALAEKNDYEPEQIVAWIKQNIQFTPSPGYQLAPQSALQAATGNALEQALLLQNVLVQAGLEVRLVKATLDEGQAMTLLRESFVSSEARAWQLDSAIRDEYFKRLSLQFSGDDNKLNERQSVLDSLTPWPDSAVYQDAQSLAADLSTAIKEQQAASIASTPSLLLPWLSNAQDYYFVKYRWGQGDPWLEAHPAFSVSDPTIVSSSYHTEGLEQYQHKVTLQAFITRELDGETQTIPVSGVHKTTVVELVETQLQFDTIPSGIQQALADKSLDSLEGGQFFIPSINSELAPNARLFTLDGRDYSPAELSDPMAEIGIAADKKVSDLTKRLDGALGKKPEQGDKTLGDKVSNSRLIHYFLAIEWSAPNGYKRSLHRTIYRGQPGLTPSQELASVTQHVALAVTPATLAPAAELYSSLDTIRSAFALMAEFNEEQYSDAQMLKQMRLWARERTDLVFNSVATLAEEAAGSARLFSHAPVMALKWEEQTAQYGQRGSNTESSTRTTFDYLINAAQIAVVNGEMIEMVPSRTLGYGVWSTYGESIVVSGTEQRDGLSADSTSAANAFNRALVHNELSVLSSALLDSANSSAANTVPVQLAERIVEDTEYIYLLPQADENNALTAYYRINPTTGEALGYSIDGRGSVFSETTIAYLAVASQTVSALAKVAACAHGDPPPTAAEGRACLGCVVLQHSIAMIAALTLGPAGTIAAQFAADGADAGCSFL